MNIDFKFYWTLFLRRLSVMMAVFLFCAGIGVALAVKLPTVYSTTARLLVEAPQISDLPGAIRTDGAEQLEIIQQRLMTRANLIDIANRRKVFGDATRMNPDALVTAMRNATEINRSSGRNRATLMSVSFKANNPQVVAAVVNDYVTLVLNENTRLRTGRAESTLAFFSQEVDRLNTELDLQSERIVAFKNTNAGALPDSLNYRLNRESLIQERVARNEREIASLRDQRQRIIQVYETTGRIQAPQEDNRSPAEKKLQQLQGELESLKLVYSETNPRVRVLMTQISQVESQIAAEGGSSGEDDTTQESILNIALVQIDSQIASLQETVKTDNAELESLRASIERTAANGIALDALERDYNNARQQYSDAIARRDQAQVSEQIELSARGQRITVIEQASVPNRPSSPNRPVVVLGGVGAGLAAMAALFLLLEMLNRTIRRPVELTKSLGITPLATIPYMETRLHFWVRRTLKLTLLVAVIIAVPIGLWAIDTYYRPLDLIYTRLLSQIGI
jgi:polysaccharide chain length determinant protein (PEP-CTERM system associated)